MSDDFTRRYRDAMDALHFSGGEKIKLAEAVEAASRRENGGTSTMKRKHIGKTTIAIAIAAVLLLGATGVAAANGWFGWSPGLQQKLNVSDEQAQALLEAEDSPVRTALASDTHHGVTLTAEQSVADASNILVALRITGTDIPDGARLIAGAMEAAIDGQPAAGYGEEVVADGTATEYAFSGGAAEVDIFIVPSAENLEGGLLGKEIELRFTDLMIDPVIRYPDSPDTPAIVPVPADPTETLSPTETLVDGTWVLRWTLEGSPETRTAALRAPLGDTGATLTDVTLSPISALLRFEMESQTKLVPHRDINGPDSEGSGESTMVEVDADPPSLAGVMLVDGTIWTRITYSATGRFDTTGLVFTENNRLNRIIDPDAVAALLFYDKESGSDMYFTVPLQ